MKDLLTSTTAQFEIRGHVYSIFENNGCMLQVNGQCLKSDPISPGQVRSDVKGKDPVDSVRQFYY